jgi:hypothetical protein
MKLLSIITFTLSASLFGITCCSQGSLYAKKIDSLWFNSYNPRELKSKRVKVGDANVQYSFYKRSGKMRSIISISHVEKESLIFFYLADKLVMISPSGQQPYFISNDRLVYAAEMRHTNEQIDILITRGYRYLDQGYKKQKKQKPDAANASF